MKTGLFALALAVTLCGVMTAASAGYFPSEGQIEMLEALIEKTPPFDVRHEPSGMVVMSRAVEVGKTYQVGATAYYVKVGPLARHELEEWELLPDGNFRVVHWFFGKYQCQRFAASIMTPTGSYVRSEDNTGATFAVDSPIAIEKSELAQKILWRAGLKM